MLLTPVTGRLDSLQADTTALASAACVITPEYHLKLEDQSVALNTLLGGGIGLSYRGLPTCLNCQSHPSKLYGGGYCYPCFSTLARCDLCIVSPDRCHYHLGTCREPQWGETFCMQPHTVYLANTSGTKVGITRHGRELKRWLDQGAEQALALIKTPSRRSAGYVEHLLKQQLNDKTNWRQLVMGVRGGRDLAVLAESLRASVNLQDAFQQTPVDDLERSQVQWLDEPELVTIEYPVLQFSPAQRMKVTPEQPEICDNLLGVIGQYLLLTRGVVFLPDYRGLAVDVTFSEPFDLPDERTTESLSQQDSLF